MHCYTATAAATAAAAEVRLREGLVSGLEARRREIAAASGHTPRGSRSCCATARPHSPTRRDYSPRPAGSSHASAPEERIVKCCMGNTSCQGACVRPSEDPRDIVARRELFAANNTL